MDMISKIFRGKAPITVAGVILIGVIGSAIYDVVVKPGYSVVSRYLFELFTFGSQQMRDATFSNASLDPTPAVLVFMFLFLTTAVVVYSISLHMSSERNFRKFVRYRVFDRGGGLEAPERTEGAESKLEIDLIYRWIIYFSRLTTMVLVILCCVGYLSLSQSMIVWRVFQGNLNIVSPYVTQEQLNMFKSEFARVKTEKDYREVNLKLDVVAKVHGIELRGSSL